MLRGDPYAIYAVCSERPAPAPGQLLRPDAGIYRGSIASEDQCFLAAKPCRSKGSIIGCGRSDKQTPAVHRSTAGMRVMHVSGGHETHV